MEYILVNNGYHILDAESYANKNDYSIIVVPHKINFELREQTFHGIYQFKSPFGASMLSWLRLDHYFSANRRLKQCLKIDKSDRLLVYSEFEIFNHSIIRHFKNIGATVSLIEEGIATYVIDPHQGKFSTKAFLGTIWMKYILGLKKSYCTLQESGITPFVNDDEFESILVYGNQKIPRSIDAVRMDSVKSDDYNKRGGNVLFLNEPIYDYYLGFQEYETIMTMLVLELSKKFDKVLFKFHPRESADVRMRICKLLDYQNVTILYDDSPAELMSDDLTIGYSASFICTALLPLSRKGIEPIFLYKFIPKFSENQILMNIDRTLIEDGIMVPSTLIEIDRCGKYTNGTIQDDIKFNEPFSNE